MSNRTSVREKTHRSALTEYFDEINDTPLLTAEMERDLARRVAQGDPYAREHMVKANLRLVVNIARGYLNKGLALEDLIEEGNLGLLRAVEGFDEKQQTRFSTYASYWIKQSIRRALMNNPRPIRLPAYMNSLLAKYKRASVIIAERIGRTPTVEEVGKALKLSKKKIEILEKAIVVHHLTPHPEGSDEDGFMLGEVLIDEANKPVDVILIENDELGRVLQELARLDEREATVIRMRFGLEPYAPMTLREVGENLELTRERVRQLEHQALMKLLVSVSSEGGPGGKLGN